MELQVLLELIRRLSATGPLTEDDVRYVNSKAEGLSEKERATLSSVMGINSGTSSDADDLLQDEEDGFDGEPQVVEKEEDDPADPDDDVLVQPPQLASHQIDVPEEPERVRVVTQIWNAAASAFQEVDLGELMLIPSGCEEPEFLSPYENAVSFRSPLPRDKEHEANLYALYQQNGWASRPWIRKNLDEEIDDIQVDKEIADDIPVLMALQGKPDLSSGVGQTAGAAGKGDNNGAPHPPGPGPGRGNKAAPGDNGATPTTPANAAPGSGV